LYWKWYRNKREKARFQAKTKVNHKQLILVLETKMTTSISSDMKDAWLGSVQLIFRLDDDASSVSATKWKSVVDILAHPHERRDREITALIDRCLLEKNKQLGILDRPEGGLVYPSGVQPVHTTKEMKFVPYDDKTIVMEPYDSIDGTQRWTMDELAEILLCFEFQLSRLVENCGKHKAYIKLYPYL
jgi:hypothetical protein